MLEVLDALKTSVSTKRSPLPPVLSITQLRTGSFFPSLLERRRRTDQALFAVIMEAYETA